MSQSKHTPGPWIDGHENTQQKYRPIYARQACGQQIQIAEVDPFEIGFSISQEEFDANARLIAASPELVDVLESLVIWFDSNPDVETLEHEGDEYLAKTLVTARTLWNRIKSAPRPVKPGVTGVRDE